jgi:hypothetical protein
MLIMFDTIRRSFLAHDAFDRAMFVVELLVLAIIGIEAIIHTWHWRRIRRRTRRLRKCLAEGQSLQSRAFSLRSLEEVKMWNRETNAWVEDTKALLTRYSSQASAAFSHDPGRILNLAALHRIQGDAHAQYTKLQDCLDGLLGIIEKPDVYL